MKIKKETTIYVLCPAYIKSGGPELLHQLVKKLNDNKIQAYITYYNINKNNKNYRSKEFDKYTNQYKEINEIEDNENNIIVMPETVEAIKNTKKIKFAKKVIWWLSVDNFLKGYRIKTPLKVQTFFGYVKLLLKGKITFSFNAIRKADYHLCQSKYATEFLKKHNIENYLYLSDYLNDTYLKIKEEQWGNKENIVLFNPKKGKKFTNKIIKTAPQLNWIPIQNLSTEQVKELLLKSKVYIDFGHHPGKDRFPREAAMCGCCIITGKKGAAKYYEDVSIEDEFKFEDKEKNINKIIERIVLCLNDYDNQNRKFNNYRNIISKEKEKFIKEVEEIFEKE